MSSPLRILLVDDHTLFRESLVRLLEGEPSFQVVGHCATATQASRLLRTNQADVILLDYDLGEESGTDLLEDIQRRGIKTKVLMVTAGMRDRVTRATLNSGVSGIIFKHSGPTQLIEAIQRVAQGEMWLDSALIHSLIMDIPEAHKVPQAPQPLTDRQKQVLRFIFDGFTNKEIAWRLQVSESSIKAVIQELFHKAGVRTRSQLVRIAIEKHADDWLES